jgi:hypothetical protein
MFGSNASLFYKCDKENDDCVLLANVGITRKQADSLKKFEIFFTKIKENIKDRKIRLDGSLENYGLKNIKVSKNFKRFSIIPLKTKSGIKAFVMLLFKNNKNKIHSELFEEIFSTQIYSILKNYEIV